MNNGKVRIYELSRELNLDNRDILAVCDQLNIAVKSHSSTITEDEAAQIRTAAEKQSTSHSSANKPNPPAQANGTQANGNQVKKAGVQPPVKKQQILEIRRTRPISEPPRRPDVEALPPEAVTAPIAVSSPPRPVARLNAPIRPVRPGEDGGSENGSSDSNGALTQPVALLEQEEILPAPDVSEQDPERELEEQPAVARQVMPAETVSPPEPPELGLPPSRPAAPAAKATPSYDVIQPNVANRPTLKRARVEQGQPAEPVRTESVRVEMRDPPSRPRSISATETEVKPKPVLGGLRTKPVRPDGTTDKAAPGAPGSPPAAGDDLRRPTPPRAPRKGKDWEEEEDEEAKEKAAKAAATKGKRRVQVIEDDDEDLDAALNGDENATVQVTLSLERPPKPKGRPGQTKAPAAATPAPKSKSRESSRGFRRDRREQEAKPERPEKLTLTGSLTVSELAQALITPETEIIKTLFLKGILANVNQILDIPTIEMVAQEIGVEIETVAAEAEAKKVTEMLDISDMESLQRRPPVVTIMGHVDHGKTTLLDSIRKTKVAQGEAGGITQHIGAYHVDVEMNGETQQVVFLDTPGHEAFTAMRARGTRVTDVAVLVVAADDGVRPQTIEAISHAKAAEVPIVVAINKIDKEGAQPDRVKQELTEFGLVPEEWGGETIMVPVSALNGENLDTLLEMILLVTEVEDLYANPDRPAKGTVIEANLDKARGPVATLLIQNGTLRVGNVLVAGSAFGKVRAMVDDRGKRVEAAAPSFAVEVLGLSDVPAAGDEFNVYLDEKEARALAGDRSDQQRQSRLQQSMSSRRVSLNTLSAQAQEGELKELNLILKADVQGSVEAILGALQQLPQREVQVRVLLAAPGEITETDVDLAAASDAVIVGFNTTLASGARQASDEAGVDVREYNIIYKLLEDIQGAMEGLLEPEMVEEPLGQVEVRAVFPVGRGAVAGCYVLSGKAVRNCRVRVRRGNNVVHEGNLDSLKRMKEDTREVAAGYECGIGLDNFNAWEIGDIIETFRLASKRRTLSAA